VETDSMTARSHNLTMDKAARAEFQIQPLADARPLWRRLTDALPGATLYHREAWLELLARCWGLRLSVATIGRGDEVGAGCVLARRQNLLSQWLVGLPFSDFCSPLAVDERSSEALLTELVRRQPECCLEMRGAAAPWPWQSVNCFERWTLDLAQPFATLERAMGHNFRANARRALRSGVRIESGCSAEHVARFYALQIATRRRLGVPPQPRRLFRMACEIFSRDGNCEIWLASVGGRDAAGLFVLRDGDDLYCKWSARRPDTVEGASHLLTVSLIEKFAGKARLLDRGRVDIRNAGLRHFKKDQGAKPSPLPYAYFPGAPSRISAETLTGPMKIASRVWRHLPLPVTRLLGSALYGYLA
jgi:hypothetical protein